MDQQVKQMEDSCPGLCKARARAYISRHLGVDQHIQEQTYCVDVHRQPLRPSVVIHPDIYSSQRERLVEKGVDVRGHRKDLLHIIQRPH